MSPDLAAWIGAHGLFIAALVARRVLSDVMGA